MLTGSGAESVGESATGFTHMEELAKISRGKVELFGCLVQADVLASASIIWRTA